MKYIFLVISFLILFIGCKEKETEGPASVVGTWIMVDSYTITKGVKEPSNFQASQECSRDDEITYSADGTISWGPGAIKCTPDENEYSCCSWYEWDKNNKQIIRKSPYLDTESKTIIYKPNGQVADILELTSTTMALNPNPDPIQTRSVFVYKRK